MASLQFLISTMNGKFDPDEAGLRAVQCLVINQIQEGELRQFEEWAAPIQLKGGKVINVAERGLSKSRNRAINSASADICVISDDDLVFDQDASDRIQEIFCTNPDVDVVTFQARDEGGRLLRHYPDKPFRHTVATAARVLSVEIAFRRPAVLTSQITFDERFGLGAQFVSGEENIFIADLVRSGLSVMYFPVCVVTHRGETSGGQFQNDNVVVSKGAIVRRMFGVASYPIAVGFALKKSWQHRINPFRMMALVSRGWFSGAR